ncbi:MAG: hypothetical protein K0Q77_71 [Anaerosporomusa subterranea]|jgi:hypothetical protein|nr:hypothetical protein [Anaerosporomusa subterranea]
MVVYGYEIKACIIGAIADYMWEKKQFNFYDIKHELERMGVPENIKTSILYTYSDISSRAANRIIQQQRRSGNIKYYQKKFLWQWVGEGKQ